MQVAIPFLFAVAAVVVALFFQKTSHPRAVPGRWTLDSRRVGLGLPNYSDNGWAEWNVGDGGLPMRPFFMPAIAWLRDGTEWYCPHPGVVMRWDGPAEVGRSGQYWHWIDDDVTEESHRWGRRRAFLPVLRGIPFSPAIFAAL